MQTFQTIGHQYQQRHTNKSGNYLQNITIFPLSDISVVVYSNLPMNKIWQLNSITRKKGHQIPQFHDSCLTKSSRDSVRRMLFSKIIALLETYLQVFSLHRNHNHTSVFKCTSSLVNLSTQNCDCDRNLFQNLAMVQYNLIHSNIAISYLIPFERKQFGLDLPNEMWNHHNQNF